MINIMKKIINNKKITSFFYSIIIYITLCYQDILIPYNFLSILLFITIYYFIYHINYETKYKKELLLLSGLLSICLIYGRILYTYRYDASIDTIKELLTVKNLVYFLGISSFIHAVISLIVPYIIELKPKYKKSKYNVFIVSFIIIFICYLIYYIAYYPGILSSDSIDEINMVLGNVKINDHHTIFHIIFIMIPFKIMNIMTDNINICIGAVSFIQMLLVSLTYAYVLNFLYKRKVSVKIIIGMLLYYVILPVNGFYSITIWKDIVFSLMIVLLTLETIKLLEKENISVRNSFSFIIISIFTILARNNALYMYIIFAIVTIIIFRKYLTSILLIFLIVFGTYGIIKGPIYKAYHIEKSSTSEYIAIPLQQIGRMAYKNVKFNKTEKKAIEKIIPFKELKKVYNPEIVDSIKFNKNFNNKAFEKNKIKYLKLWFGLCIKNPKIAIESYFISTLGYWYPGVEYWVTVYDIEKNTLGIERQKATEKVRNKMNQLLNSNNPLIGYANCIGFFMWLIGICIFIISKRKKISSLYIFVPVIGIWITLLIATPVFAEYRYIYSAIICLPIYFGFIYSKERRRD